MGGTPSTEEGVVRSASNDHLDWGLFSRGFNVWQPSWARQEAYGNGKQYLERVTRKGKL